MKLKTQFYINSFLVITLFSLSYVLIFSNFQKIRNLQDLSLMAAELKVTAGDFQLMTNSIFLEKNDFSVLVKNWNDIGSNLDRETSGLLEAFSSHKLPEQLQSSLQSLKEGASIMQGYRMSFASSAGDILKEETLADQVRFNGLYGIFLNLGQDEQPYWRGLLRNLEKSVEQVNSGNRILHNNLRIINQRLDDYRANLIRIIYIRLLAIIALIILLNTLYLNRFSRKLTGGFRKLEENMEMMATRDLTMSTDLKGSTEMVNLGRNFNKVSGSFSDFIDEVKQVSYQSVCLQDTLAAGTSETLAALQQIGKNIETLEETLKGMEQNTGLTEESVLSISSQIKSLNTSIEEQTGLIQKNLDSVEDISASIEQMNSLVEEGKRKSSSMTDKLEIGSEKVDQSHSIILKAAKSIQNVMEITRIINEISDQTNILSMNAAIESAHAGEAGKGFAVVAEEIRILAESTAENANQIDSTLNEVTQNIDMAIAASTESHESMNYLNQGLTELSGSLDEINSGMKQLSSAGNAILSSSRSLNSIASNIESSSGTISGNADNITSVVSTMRESTGFVSGNIVEISQGSREIIATMKEVHSVSEDNKAGLNSLENLIASFKTENPPAEECLD